MPIPIPIHIHEIPHFLSQLEETVDETTATTLIDRLESSPPNILMRITQAPTHPRPLLAILRGPFNDLLKLRILDLLLLYPFHREKLDMDAIAELTMMIQTSRNASIKERGKMLRQRWRRLPSRVAQKSTKFPLPCKPSPRVAAASLPPTPLLDIPQKQEEMLTDTIKKKDAWKEEYLPKNWWATKDKSGKVYYINVKTRATSSSKPLTAEGHQMIKEMKEKQKRKNAPAMEKKIWKEDGLPPSWFATNDITTGMTYYFNDHTAETSWAKPTQ